MIDTLCALEERAREARLDWSRDYHVGVETLGSTLNTLAGDVSVLVGVVRRTQAALRRIVEHDGDGMVPTVDGERSVLHGITSAARVARDALAECEAVLKEET